MTTAQGTHRWSVAARHTAATLCMCAVLLGILVAASVFITIGVWPNAALVVCTFGASVVGLVVLSVLPARTAYLGVIVALSAILGVLGLALLGLDPLMVWTTGVHTFVSGLRSIGFTFTMTAPLFSPLLAAILALVLSERPAWVRSLSVFGVMGGAFLLSMVATAAQ